MRKVHISNAKDLFSYITIGITEENLFLDFKREIDLSKKQNLSEELACDICQFINTDGGCLLIGIEERKNTSGVKVAHKLSPVTNYNEICQFINDSVLELIFPKKQLFEVIPINYRKNDIVISINISPTQSSLYCVKHKNSNKYFQFPYRTNYGKKYFNFDELELRMHSSNREKYIKIQNIWKDSKEVKLLTPIVKKTIKKEKLWDHRDYSVFIGGIFENEIELLINDRSINIPYGLITDVWNTEDNKIGLILSAKIIDPEDRSRFILKL